MKSYPIYKEEYNVYLIDTDEKIYRVETYFEVQKEEVKADKKLPTTRDVIKIKDIYVEEVFKFGGEKK